MPLHGVDISQYQKDTYRPSEADAFAFVKATEGHTVRNPHHDEQVTRLRAAGLVVGHYHWIWPGDLPAQVDYFAEHANVRAGDIVALDWENPDPVVPNSDKDAMLRLLQQRFPDNRVILYTYTGYWRHHDTSGFVGDGLWIAHYGVAKPGITSPYLFWQYTSVPWDQNWAYFDSRAALRSWATRKPLPIHPKGLIMAEATFRYRNNSTWQDVPAGDGTTLNIEDPDPDTGKSLVSLVIGQTPGADLVSTVQLDGLAPGQVAEAYFVRVQPAADGGPAKIDHRFRNPGQVTVSGRSDGQPASAEVSFKDVVDDADPEFRIRVHLSTPVSVRARMMSRGWVLE
jgi:hypothetical protein